jgi:hypothetical protein
MARSCIIEIGRELTAAKALVGHGNWEAWLRAEFGWEERTAQRHISVYETFGKSDRLTDTASVMITSEALYALAAPTVPQVVRQQAVAIASARARSGLRSGSP